jgi:acetyltransferase-like isoleucine patch superfamily enzyme
VNRLFFLLLRGIRGRARSWWARQTLSALRRSGHAIAPTVRLGARCRIDVFAGGRLQIDDGVDILDDTWIAVEAGDELWIGANTFISRHCTVSGSVRIGRDVLVAGYVTILDAQHVFSASDRPIRMQGGAKRPIVIGDDVWIGTTSAVLGGASIGNHAVVGANSVVTGAIPEWAVAVGSPASVTRIRDH